jgi:hypothetical protein
MVAWADGRERRTHRRLIVGCAVVVALLVVMAGVRDGAVIEAQAAKHRTSLLFPRPVPVSAMSLEERARWQWRALRHYSGALAAHRKVAARRPLTKRELVRHRWYMHAVRWTRAELAETQRALDARRLATMGPQEAICHVFGPECQKALRVARCESGFNVRAVSPGGLYWGLFQQGAYSRSTYGFGWTALEQARAAKRHRDAEGWGPWPVCGRL